MCFVGGHEGERLRGNERGGRERERDRQIDRQTDRERDRLISTFVLCSSMFKTE